MMSIRRPRLLPFVSAAILVAACDDSTVGPKGAPLPDALQTTELGRFDEPWAMTVLPDGALLITEKRGALKLRENDGTVRDITGTPEVAYGGQGGLGDVVLHPDFADNQFVYLSWAEAGEGGAGAAVGRARFDRDAGTLAELEVIWRQVPKVSGQGHYGHRLAFDGDGYLWITSGERQKFDPAQDMQSNLGKLVRLHDDGAVPDDNPFVDMGGVTAQIWSLGHRNPLGIAFAADGTLWMHEMGPKGGDELNRIERGQNYGWPLVCEGVHYSGESIPKHATRPDFVAPETFWTPVIAPAGFIIYSGKLIPAWRGHGFIGGLASEALVRVTLGASVEEAERFAMGARIREVEEAADGASHPGARGRLECAPSAHRARRRALMFPFTDSRERCAACVTLPRASESPCERHVGSAGLLRVPASVA